MNALALLFLLAFLVSVDLRIIAPVLPSIIESLRATPGGVGLAMTSYSFAYGAGQLVYGPLSDRYGRVAVVRQAALGFCVCTVLSALCATTWQFVAVRLLAGVFAGSVIPLTLVYIGDTVEYARRQVVVGRFSVVTSAGLAFSAGVVVAQIRTMGADVLLGMTQPRNYYVTRAAILLSEWSRARRLDSVVEAAKKLGALKALKL